jgi:hypothetical protein
MRSIISEHDRLVKQITIFHKAILSNSGEWPAAHSELDASATDSRHRNAAEHQTISVAAL